MKTAEAPSALTFDALSFEIRVQNAEVAETQTAER